MEEIFKNQIEQIKKCKYENIIKKYNFENIDYTDVSNQIIETQEAMKKLSEFLIKKMDKIKDEKMFDYFLNIYLRTKMMYSSMENLLLGFSR